jgi:hypothetical protein
MNVFHHMLLALLFLIVLPVAAADAPAAGTPLPADGGEPGKVVLAALAAQRNADFAQWSAAWHPRMWEGKEEQTRKTLERMRKHSPASARIVGGHIDGDRAIVQVEATFTSKTATSEAELELLDGAWRLVRM